MVAGSHGGNHVIMVVWRQDVGLLASGWRCWQWRRCAAATAAATERIHRSDWLRHQRIPSGARL